MDSANERKVFVYILVDPRDSAVRYVGSTLNVQQTMSRHMTSPTNKAKNAWVWELRGLQLRPNLEVIDETTIERRDEIERKWIAHYLRQGANLFNGVFTGQFDREAAGLPPSWQKERKRLLVELKSLLLERGMLPAGYEDKPSTNYLIAQAMGIAIKTLKAAKQKEFTLITMNDLPAHQNTADYLKGIALAIKAPELMKLRRRILSMIQIFERTGFQQQGFVDVFNEINPPLLVEGSKILRLPDAADRDVLEAIAELLTRHLEIADPTPREVFTTETAANYLGVTSEGINYHQKMGNLVGRLMGHTRIYTKDELDHFNAHRKTAGRPRAEAAE